MSTVATVILPSVRGWGAGVASATVTAASLAHADALRRRLTLLARSGEQIDWAARRVVRTPAALQDDGAVAWARDLSPSRSPGSGVPRP